MRGVRRPYLSSQAHRYRFDARRSRGDSGRRRSVPAGRRPDGWPISI